MPKKRFPIDDDVMVGEQAEVKIAFRVTAEDEAALNKAIDMLIDEAYVASESVVDEWLDRHHKGHIQVSMLEAEVS